VCVLVFKRLVVESIFWLMDTFRLKLKNWTSLKVIVDSTQTQNMKKGNFSPTLLDVCDFMFKMSNYWIRFLLATKYCLMLKINFAWSNVKLHKEAKHEKMQLVSSLRFFRFTVETSGCLAHFCLMRNFFSWVEIWNVLKCLPFPYKS